MDMIRVLVALSPRMYRQAIALSIHRNRPGLDVRAASQEDAERELETFRPHLLVHNDTAPIPEAALAGEREGVLSARELEVLLLASRGLSNRRIASLLHISEATVKRHLANVYEKMGVRSRGEAAREALMRDWITIEEIKGPAPGDGQADRG